MRTGKKHLVLVTVSDWLYSQVFRIHGRISTRRKPRWFTNSYVDTNDEAGQICSILTGHPPYEQRCMCASLKPHFKTLAEKLKAAGYMTHGILGKDLPLTLNWTTRGFDTVECFSTKMLQYSAITLENAFRDMVPGGGLVIDSTPDDTPCFLWAHFDEDLTKDRSQRYDICGAFENLLMGLDDCDEIEDAVAMITPLGMGGGFACQQNTFAPAQIIMDRWRKDVMVTYNTHELHDLLLCATGNREMATFDHQSDQWAVKTHRDAPQALRHARGVFLHKDDSGTPWMVQRYVNLGRPAIGWCPRRLLIQSVILVPPNRLDNASYEKAIEFCERVTGSSLIPQEELTFYEYYDRKGDRDCANNLVKGFNEGAVRNYDPEMFDMLCNIPQEIPDCSCLVRDAKK